MRLSQKGTWKRGILHLLKNTIDRKRISTNSNPKVQ